MRHTKQGQKECQLATMAMLFDTGLDTMRALMLGRAEAVTGHAWSTWNDFSMWCAYMGGIGPWAEVVLPVCREHGLDLPALIPMHEDNGEAPDLRGRGQICLKGPDSWGHAVAYEDGIVYDPSLDAPEPFDTWWATKVERGWRSYHVTPLKP
jgi:hypothetical protein